MSSWVWSDGSVGMSSGDTQEDDGRVTLHVYDAGMSELVRGMNHILRPFGSGAFHCGVVVYGSEWSYSNVQASEGGPVAGTGVFDCDPMQCEGHRYLETVEMGETSLRDGEVAALLAQLREEWPVAAYDTVTRNCCHFSSELCCRLGVGDIPPWVTSLAAGFAATEAMCDPGCCSAGGDAPARAPGSEIVASPDARAPAGRDARCTEAHFDIVRAVKRRPKSAGVAA
mmetsp:Transcript_5878/g.16807  ORF Transcript_5878/g.16807 Transcript_5878/m.16807 type:complete len:227 (+) Transcript_5878:49-729(+)